MQTCELDIAPLPNRNIKYAAVWLVFLQVHKKRPLELSSMVFAAFAFGLTSLKAGYF